MFSLIAALLLLHVATAQSYYPAYQYQQYTQQWPQYQPQYQYQQPIVQPPPQQYYQQPAQQLATLPPIHPLPVARQPLPRQPLPTPEQIQYLQQGDPTRKARRFIASYWDPHKQQTIYYEQLVDQPSQFSQQQQQQQLQFPQSPNFPPPPPPPSPQFTPQQPFPHPFFRQLQQQQSAQTPVQPPPALHLPPTAATAPQRKLKIEQQSASTEQQRPQAATKFSTVRVSQPHHTPQIPIKSGNTAARPQPPLPPTKFSPYPQDVFNPLDKTGAPVTAPEVLVSGGSKLVHGGIVEQSHIEEVPFEQQQATRVLQTFQPQSPPPPPARPQPQQQQQFQGRQMVHPKPQRPQATRPTAPLPKQPRPIQAVPAPRPVSTLQRLGAEESDEIGDANSVFLQCCKRRSVDKKCESRCNFDVMNKKMLMAMFLGTDPCPQSYGRDLLSCAAQDLDHTQCCIERGVHETSAGKKCLGFCNMTPENSFQADASMLPCWAVLNDIKGCFRDNLEESLE